MHDKKQMTETKARLEARLESLQERLVEINNTLREPEDEDSEDQAADLNEDDVLEHLAHAGRTEVLQIEAALNRLNKGTYGICIDCGSAIAERRLQALPETERCLTCAQRLTGRK